MGFIIPPSELKESAGFGSVIVEQPCLVMMQHLLDNPEI